MTAKVGSVFITGANRGIGFNLLQEISKRLKPTVIFATFRNVAQAKELQEYAKTNSAIELILMDTRDYHKHQDIVKLVDEKTKGKGLNLLINNAGITSKYARITQIKKEALSDNFEVNVIAPIMLTKAFIPLLEKAADAHTDLPQGIGRAAVINMSSILGSITMNDNGGMYPYRCSKAALNMATKSMSLDFKKAGIIATAIHPGWVQTDMGGPKAPLTPAQSVEGIVKVLEELNEEDSGLLIQYDGTRLPW